MESGQFDRLARAFGARRSRRAAATVLGGLLTAPLLARGDTEARKKKKKKPCAKKCKTGCCTGKRGKCIQPEQQSLTQCGTGGAICRSTGCGCLAGRPCPSGQCCRGDGSCGACLVFLSSTQHNGNLGGLAGADAMCQNLATAAGLPGTYMAWLSDDSESPSTRFTQATVAYTLVDGTTVAASWTALTTSTPANAINRTEANQVLNAQQAWTNTQPDGTAGGPLAGAHCQNWTSSLGGPVRGNVGLSSVTSESWTAFDDDPCDEEAIHRIYCFQQR